MMESPPTPRESQQATPLPRTPFVLLALMTIATLGGPIAIHRTLRGGAARGWPPDRAVEWWVFGLCTGAEVVLMITCLMTGFVGWRRVKRVAPGSEDGLRRAGG